MGRPPSELYGIDDEVTAWCFNRAILTFGNALESRLSEVAEGEKDSKAAKQRAERELQKWLSSNDSDRQRTMARQFRDPLSGAMVRK